MVSKRLPRIGLGMAALGRPGYITLNRTSVLGSERGVQDMKAQAFAVLDKLFETAQPPVWIDCARSYGLSEVFVGDYIKARGIASSNVYLSSKWGYTYVADWNVSLEPGAPHEVKDHSVENFVKQCQETIDNLGNSIDLYQIHSATLESGVLSDERVHAALAAAREKYGWKIGLSVSGVHQDEIIRTAMRILVPATSNSESTQDDTCTDTSQEKQQQQQRQQTRLFDSVQCTFNLLEQGPMQALKEAHDAGMDIIIKEGLANGRILQHPSLLEYAQRLSCSPDQLALGAILAQDWSPSVLSGAVTPQQLESNLGALQVCKKLQEQPELLQEIMAACRMSTADYWQERSSLAWN
jgi:aryl-alcohol dehydrogenase-like predicted oxidoreductase